jgi:hypothetical protein
MQVGSRDSSPEDARADDLYKLWKARQVELRSDFPTSIIPLAWNVCAHMPGT